MGTKERASLAASGHGVCWYERSRDTLLSGIEEEDPDPTESASGIDSTAMAFCARFICDGVRTGVTLRLARCANVGGLNRAVTELNTRWE